MNNPRAFTAEPTCAWAAAAGQGTQLPEGSLPQAQCAAPALQLARCAVLALRACRCLRQTRCLRLRPGLRLSRPSLSWAPPRQPACSPPAHAVHVAQPAVQRLWTCLDLLPEGWPRSAAGSARPEPAMHLGPPHLRTSFSASKVSSQARWTASLKQAGPMMHAWVAQQPGRPQYMHVSCRLEAPQVACESLRRCSSCSEAS